MVRRPAVGEQISSRPVCIKFYVARTIIIPERQRERRTHVLVVVWDRDRYADGHTVNPPSVWWTLKINRKMAFRECRHHVTEHMDVTCRSACQHCWALRSGYSNVAELDRMSVPGAPRRIFLQRTVRKLRDITTRLSVSCISRGRWHFIRKYTLNIHRLSGDENLEQEGYTRMNVTLLTYLRSWVLLEKLPTVQLLYNFPAF
jgi:hypothetical protein